MEDLEPKSKEEWYSIMKEKREKLRELVLDDDELVSIEELLERFDDRGIKIYEDDSGTTHYEDMTLERRTEESDGGFVEAKTVKWPVTRATRLVESGKHPDELKSVMEKAEHMAEFDRSVTPVFNDQLEDSDFPLEYPPREE